MIALSVTGSMIMFRLSELTRLKSSGPIRMLITNTKVGRNTKALVAGVSERTLRHPDAMAAVFTAVDSISKELSDVIQSAAHDDVSITAKEEKLEELMEMNQGLLQCMGVSHASIDTVLRTTLRYKLASKLTGAGGGGCVLTLLPTCILHDYFHFSYHIHFLFSISLVLGLDTIANFDLVFHHSHTWHDYILSHFISISYLFQIYSCIGCLVFLCSLYQGVASFCFLLDVYRALTI